MLVPANCSSFLIIIPTRDILALLLSIRTRSSWPRGSINGQISHARSETTPEQLIHLSVVRFQYSLSLIVNCPDLVRVEFAFVVLYCAMIAWPK